MSTGGPGESPSQASRGRPDAGFLGLLRVVALVGVVAGAGGSLALMLRAGRRTPTLLLVAFVVWVLSPFMALGWAHMVSKRWSVPTRATLDCVTLVLALGSLATYGDLVSRPTGSPNAFFFVAVPPASCLLMAIVVPIAALISRRLSRRGAGAS